MVNPSPDVIGRDFHNSRDDEGEGSPIGEINIINLIDSTVKHKLGDGHILHNHLNNNNNNNIHHTYTNVLSFSPEY
jgi:hypothetical protein